MLLATTDSRTQSGEAKNGGAAHQRANAPLHCGVLVEARYLAHAQPRGMVRALTAGGHRVTVFNAQSALLDSGNSRWFAGLDLLITRGCSKDLLARLSVAEAAGIPTLHRRQAIAALLDKAQMAARLRAAGIPAPPTWSGATAQVRREIRRDVYPLILKPVNGDDCRGIRIVDTPHALGDAAGSESCVTAQRLLPNNGYDVNVKLYIVGENVWAVRKRFALRGGASAATRLALPKAWRNLARRCGEIFGLELFRVDCIETDGALQVIEVNDFPNYTGIPAADFMLAVHAVQFGYARRRANSLES